MVWLVLAILTAFFESLKDVKSKQSLVYLDEYWVTWATQVIAVICLLPMLWTKGIPTIQPGFWPALLVGGSLNVVAFLLYIQAIKAADLSLTVPLIALTPLFMLVTSPIIVGEFPGPMDAIGVVMIVIGSYILNLQPRNHDTPRDFWAPLRSLLANPGCRKMLMVAGMWSITANLDKVGVANSSPFFWSVALFAFVAAGITPILIWRRRSSSVSLPQIWPHWQLLALTGAFSAAAIGFQMVAITLAPVTQVIAVKRMSSLISILFGYFLFGEKNIRSRLTGGIVMIAGVVVITLF
jgi:drug/metabolite transporter (DMT)-like permease